MARLFSNIPPKLRLYLPILAGIIISISIITIFSVIKLKTTVYSSVERNLILEVKTLEKMLEREHDLKLDKVKTDLKVAHKLFYDGDFQMSSDIIKIPVTNQLTGNTFKENCETHAPTKLQEAYNLIREVYRRLNL